jgi:hypothetical protein
LQGENEGQFPHRGNPIYAINQAEAVSLLRTWHKRKSLQFSPSAELNFVERFDAKVSFTFFLNPSPFFALDLI